MKEKKAKIGQIKKRKKGQNLPLFHASVARVANPFANPFRKKISQTTPKRSTAIKTKPYIATISMKPNAKQKNPMSAKITAVFESSGLFELSNMLVNPQR